MAEVKLKDKSNWKNICYTCQKKHVTRVKPGISHPSPKYQNPIEKLTTCKAIHEEKTKNNTATQPIAYCCSPVSLEKSKLPDNSLFGKRRGKGLSYTLAGVRICALLWRVI